MINCLGYKVWEDDHEWWVVRGLEVVVTVQISCSQIVPRRPLEHCWGSWQTT